MKSGFIFLTQKVWKSKLVSVYFLSIKFGKPNKISKRRNAVKNDIYGEPEIIKYKNIVATVYSPILTDEERNRRMERIKKATIRLVLSNESKGQRR